MCKYKPAGQGLRKHPEFPSEKHATKWQKELRCSGDFGLRSLARWRSVMERQKCHLTPLGLGFLIYKLEIILTGFTSHYEGLHYSKVQYFIII